ncbi:MAG: alpha-1,2-fucosyltransferase, partial [Synechococcaceae bacterium WB9_2_112]|nr:alpha-1,2-fucosyltransferase [Synechococcaceae bacterium WB9_2_112]
MHVRPDERYWDSFLSNCAQFLADEGIVPYWRVQQDAECLWDEPHFHYTPIPPSATALSGYFQCSRYFAAVAPHIRALFRPADTVHAAMLHRHAALLRPHIAAIHVRRGDYVQLPMHGILDVPWYLRAARVLLDEAPHIESFAVFSDDPGWCQTNLAALAELRPLKVVAEPDAAVALHLLSQFEFYVLSNSTFSWWGAWLGHPAAMV